MVGKRSRLEICLDVLEKISRGVKKPTNIMYKCNLSWRPLQEILISLNDRGLIEEVKEHNRRYYVITKKGRETLFYLRKLIQTLHLRRGREIVTLGENHRLLITMNEDFDFPSISNPRKHDKEGDY